MHPLKGLGPGMPRGKGVQRPGFLLSFTPRLLFSKVRGLKVVKYQRYKGKEGKGSKGTLRYFIGITYGGVHFRVA
jgi:hypothetical protein